MKALSILLIIFAVIAFAAMIVRQVFLSLAKKAKSEAAIVGYEKAAKIAGCVGIGSLSVAVLCGVIQQIIILAS